MVYPFEPTAFPLSWCIPTVPCSAAPAVFCLDLTELRPAGFLICGWLLLLCMLKIMLALGEPDNCSVANLFLFLWQNKEDF
jgi:hypothetical protein